MVSCSALHLKAEVEERIDEQEDRKDENARRLAENARQDWMARMHQVGPSRLYRNPSKKHDFIWIVGTF